MLRLTEKNLFFFFYNFINHNCTNKTTSEFKISAFILVVELGLEANVF
jgi:hypothetical protein